MRAAVGSSGFVKTMQRLTAKLDAKIQLQHSISSESAAGGYSPAARAGDLAANHVNDKRAYYRGEYLKSAHWKQLRAAKLSRNPVCEICGTARHVDVHHLRYRSLYDVTLEDLKTLCRWHHSAEHADQRGRPEPARVEHEARVGYLTLEQFKKCSVESVLAK